MVSIIIPTLNAARDLPACLSALMPGVLSGLVREVVISDGGSDDPVADIADASGARFICTAPGRGAQLAAGADVAKGDWLLFLHADTGLAPDWPKNVSTFIAATGTARRAGYFQLGFDSPKKAARRVARGANLRAKIFKLPYGDQGLLIRKHHYASLGGYQPLPLFEDVDLVRRLVKTDGRASLVALQSKAITSPDRYERDGYTKRVLKNFTYITRYFLGIAPEKIAAKYQ
ncbi:MAG: TIGR04283 family arsenosugar biosynthesis glycosyltransferase [Parvularculaceae bacterium]